MNRAAVHVEAASGPGLIAGRYVWIVVHRVVLRVVEGNGGGLEDTFA